LSKVKIGYITLSEVADVRFSSVDKHTVASEKPVRLCNYTDVFKNRFISNSMDFMSASATDREIERFGLRHGDIAITKDSETPDEIGIPALIERPASDLVLGYHLALVRAKPERCDPYFLSAALQTRYVARHYLRTAVGLTRFGLSIRAVADTPVPNLPLSLQKRIGRWYRDAARLESHTDALIAAKREQKRGLMQQLLTGKVRFPGFAKPWRTVPLKSMITLDSPGAWGDAPTDADPGVVVLRSTNITDDGRIDLTSTVNRSLEPRKRAALSIRSGDILLERSGGTDTRPVGRVAFARMDIDACYSNFLQRLRPDRTVVSPFFLFLQLMQLHASGVTNRLQAQTTGIRNLMYRAYLECCLPLPELEEQARICDVLDAATSEIELLVNQREAFAAQRRGLVERLLSGEIEVPSTDTCAA
jgi:type I restriction enzyme S subunit